MLSKTKKRRGLEDRASRILNYSARLCRANIFSLQALRAFLHHEGNARALIERAIAARRDRGEMNEDVLAILALDKAESFAGIEPLYCTCFSHLSSFFFAMISRFLTNR